MTLAGWPHRHHLGPKARFKPGGQLAIDLEAAPLYARPNPHPELARLSSSVDQRLHGASNDIAENSTPARMNSRYAAERIFDQDGQAIGGAHGDSSPRHIGPQGVCLSVWGGQRRLCHRSAMHLCDGDHSAPGHVRRSGQPIEIDPDSSRIVAHRVGAIERLK